MVNRSRDRLGKTCRMGASCLSGLLAGVFLTSCATPHRDRLSPKLESTLLGALQWLDDHQIRDRPGHGSPSRDATDAGDGARQTATIHLPGGAALEILTVGKSRAVHNEVGSWVSEIHLFPSRIPLEGRAMVSTPDANLFNTAFVLFPCFFFDDSGLEEPARFVSRMRHLGLENLRSYQRGAAYNFWRVLPGWEGAQRRSGPLNVPMPLLRATAEAHRQPDYPAYRQALRSAGISGHDLPLPPLPLWSLLQLQTISRSRLPPVDWVEKCLDPAQNPTGVDAFFNIPNDADDTAAMAMLLQLSGQPDPRLLTRLSQFRDTGRDREDGRDSWKGKDSGAFLTWLADETRPTFGNVTEGVIPLGVNNVDVIVNANVIHAIALAGRRDLPGYHEAVRLVARCAMERHWPAAGLYYPQMMIFPYAAARAWREGPVREAPMAEAMPKLLHDLLDQQETFGRNHPLKQGAFPGGEDPTEALSTALGLAALLNLGEDTARALGEEHRYQVACDRAAAYLMRCARRHLRGGVSWESGLFFSSSFQDLAHWRSEAFSTAVAMEALAKYALHYERDKGPSRFRVVMESGKTLRLRPMMP